MTPFAIIAATLGTLGFIAIMALIALCRATDRVDDLTREDAEPLFIGGGEVFNHPDPTTNIG